ncbi:hypothetical protein [Streptomyces sp. NPDC090025]|uniref:hypothetical protein n=1 Tax=Streptomyces sp. NPDC090025 TaxID=3365922 RepID=UPI003839484D
MLTLAARYARYFDVLDDRTLSAPTASERIGRQLVTVKSLFQDAAAVGTAHQELPMSLIDRNDPVVGSRMAQLEVVTTAAAEALAVLITSVVDTGLVLNMAKTSGVVGAV